MPDAQPARMLKGSPPTEDELMNRVEHRQVGVTGPQRNGEQEIVLRTARRETDFAQAHKITPSSFSPGIPPMNESREKQSPATPFVKRKWVAGTIILFIIISGLVLAFLPRWREHRMAIAKMNQLAIPTISVISLAPLISENGLTLPAEIRPWREASVSARANGYLKAWWADMGSHVQAGQLLAEIETPGLDGQLEQAKAQLVVAQANLHLAETLSKTPSVSVQAAAASVEAERANVRRLQEQISFRRVVAPFAGTITKRQVEIGDLIAAGSGGREMFHIAQTRKIRVWVRVPKPYAFSLAPGQTARLTILESPGRGFTAKVTTVMEASSSRTLLTELEVDNSQHQILPYSYGEITFKANTLNPPLILPANALLPGRHGLQVGVVDSDNTVELRSVQIGRNFGETVEILGGVTPSDRVIANPSESLVNGATVRVKALTMQ